MAYAAVNSLLHTISRFLKSDDDHIFSKSGDHILIVQNSSPEMITLLEDEALSLAEVLEELDSNSRRFSSKRLNIALDAQIRDVVFKLEDVVESHLRRQFVSQSENCIHQHPLVFFIDIEKVKQDIDSLIETLNKLKVEYIYELSSNNNNVPPNQEEEEEQEDDDDTEEEEEEEEEEEVMVKTDEPTILVGSNKLFMDIKDWILSDDNNDLGPSFICGMAGIGKTSLARKVFEDPSISSHFESRAWVTVGPQYQLKEVLRDILKQLGPEMTWKKYVSLAWWIFCSLLFQYQLQRVFLEILKLVAPQMRWKKFVSKACWILCFLLLQYHLAHTILDILKPVALVMRSRKSVSKDCWILCSLLFFALCFFALILFFFALIFALFFKNIPVPMLSEGYEYSKGRKCLVVLDDVWDEDMTKLECFSIFRNRRNCILVTSRLGSSKYMSKAWEIPFLDKKESWDLLCVKVFGEHESSLLCPSELKRAGKKIAENCEGLPLTIITVANILSKQEITPEYWNKVGADKQHSVYKEAYAKMHKVLLPSYYSLRQYLRISFLYMGLFPQNYEIHCTKLHMLWIAEGFIQFEENLNSVRKYHFRELLKNHVLIANSTPSMDLFWIDCKTVSLHSAFWYVCKKEAGKSKFFHSFTTLDDCSAQGIETQRRLCIYNPVLFAIKDAFDTMASVSAARSLLCTGVYHPYPVPVLCLGMRLLRVLYALPIHFYEFPMEVLKLIHLTYFALTCVGDLPASISKLWNLMYLIVDRRLSIKSSDGAPSYLPVEIWDMKKLVHLQVMGSDLPEPPLEGSSMMLSKLDKLLDVSPHSCTERILERLPNLTKLGIRIELSPDDAIHQHLACFDHIRDKHDLRSFKCVVVNPRIMFEVAAPLPIPLPIFPEFLQKLTLSGLGYPWEEMSKISSLPNLKVLKLLSYAFRGPKWHVGYRRFSYLKVLVIEETDLVQWTIIDDYQIPYLVRLSLKHCYNLEEIPMDFNGYLRRLEVVDCNPLVVHSANKIKEASPILGLDLFDLNVQSSWDDGN